MDDHGAVRVRNVCRSIKRLATKDRLPVADEVRASSLQYVRKISGIIRPSRKNEAIFERAVDEVAAASARLLAELAHLPAETHAHVLKA